MVETIIKLVWFALVGMFCLGIGFVAGVQWYRSGVVEGLVAIRTRLEEMVAEAKENNAKETEVVGGEK